MAFSPPEYCRLFAQKKAYQGGGGGASRAPQDPPSYAPDQCLVCLAGCRNSPRRTTKRVRLNVVKDHFDWSFGLVGEKSVHGRPSWELAPYDCSSQNTVIIYEDFAALCKLVSKECRFNHRAGKCGVVRFTTQLFFFLFWTRPKHSLLESE